jgi:hypothetical protein
LADAIDLPHLTAGAQFAQFTGASIRDRLVEALRLELLGPEGSDEVLSQSPATRYLVGMLAPMNTPMDPTEDEKLDSIDESPAEAVPAMSLSLAQSSIGLSFVVGSNAPSVVVELAWGEYHKVERPVKVVAQAAGDVDRDEDPEVTVKKKRADYDWHRTQQKYTVLLEVDHEGRQPGVKIRDDVRLDSMVRFLGNKRVVSVFLVNGRRVAAGRRPPDELWLYQPAIRVRGEGAIFHARRLERERPDADPDIASADLVYRDHIEFATGHGAAAAWLPPGGEPDRTSEIWTEVVPQREVAQVVPWVPPGTPELDMRLLARADGPERIAALVDPLLAAYESWITDRAVEAEHSGPAFRPVAMDHVALARNCLNRIRGGLKLLVDDSKAFQAFLFANRAMELQRQATVTVLSLRRGQRAPAIVEAKWRPFQLGFILECLKGIADGADDEREVADLLWFPTGGGKTEAYLGLTAFTLAYRRLRAPIDPDDTSCGTSVLMRYTLRLLTIQQFQRAAALICACEVIRSEDLAKWGDEPFTIGLWVGGSVTPNTYADAKEAIVRLKNGETLYEASPYQVLFCPWCGTDLPPSHYTSDDDLERTLIKCSGEGCPFAMSTSELGLPVLLVDQEIYRHPPSLLLATVDKFAQMAWNGRIQSLFGRVTDRCPRHGFISAGDPHAKRHNETRGWPAAEVRVSRQLAPPDLIIQDELHLISGPLGTLVGIYESAVEGLCSRQLDGKRIRPKVVASTATIRRASQQIAALFDRDVCVFPPQGLEAEDSFFARQDTSVPGRLYLGVYAPGKSVKTSLVRVYAAALSRALVEFEALPTPESDSYMTLVGYFNSLRELGGAVRLVDDDVPARLRVLRRRGFGPTRLLYEKKELTSRARSQEISATLKHLDRTFMGKQPGAYPIDILLASNMLSVGVDIDRLGLMVVSAQPKTSAEYIQATSRVGRKYPGLVVEVYNWSRPRDTSHYERFVHYHDTFYRHVEATSVTPFSARARDRALSGVLVSYLRQDNPQLATEQGANLFDPSAQSVASVTAELVERAYRVTGREEVRRETDQQLKNLVSEWRHHVAPPASRPLVYSGRGLKRDDQSKSILLQPMELELGRGMWRVAGSLREVEPELPVILIADSDPT